MLVRPPLAQMRRTECAPMDNLPTIFVADPDPAMCESIKKIAGVLELRCESYATGQEFLDSFDGQRPGCLVLEIRIPGVNGLQIQEKLGDMGATLPVIFLTACASVSIAVHAMRMGALHFLEKPFNEHRLWSTIQEAIQIDKERREAISLQATLDAGVSSLTEKELAVLAMLADCKSKRAMAAELGISVRTIEYHRTQLMRKLKIRSTAGLLRFALTMKCSSSRFLGKSLLSSLDGNGLALAQKISSLIPHAGHAAQSLHAPAGRNSK
jgi:FixJ family two-component response regulator